LRQLGVHRAQLALLGFPDEGLCVLASAYRTGGAFESPYTRRASPPDSEQILHGTLYRGEDLDRELEHVIGEFRPTLLVLPDPRDQHPDHCATHVLGHEALAKAMRAGLPPPRVLHYLIHYPGWPQASAPNAESHAGMPLSSLKAGDDRWETLALTEAEQAAKHHALESYRTQTIVMAEFLAAFERPYELFTEGEPPVSAACWCGSENIATPSPPVR
jgi:LmbE family N-acetylglucosaminyl deacetylase